MAEQALVAAAVPVPSSLAGQAVTPPVRSYIGVGFVEGMTVLAVCLTSVLGGSAEAAQGVYTAGHRFEVIWIGACRSAAEVIHLKTLRYRATPVLVGQPVGAFHAAGNVRQRASAELSVTASGAEGRPQPAALANLVAIDLGEKSL